MLKDILQLENDPNTAYLFERYFDKNQTNNKWALIIMPTLHSFIAELNTKPYITRFILDGNFPEKQWEPDDFLLPNALDFLRTQAQKIEKIIIYSGDKLQKLESAIPLGMKNTSITIISKWSEMSISEIITQILAD